MTVDLQQLRRSMEKELRQDILPFWMNYMVDRENGGFYGALTNDLQVHNEVERSLVLCARMLWTYSAAYRQYGDEAYLEMARYAYAYLTGKFYDRQHGGFYWWLNRSGRPVNGRKQTYGQAFAIYALSEYYQATESAEMIDASALELAIATFRLIEEHTYEAAYGGYIEGSARDWTRLGDMRLSDKEPYNCPKSMNTLLHVLEGYTNLLRVWPDALLLDAMNRLLQVFMDHVVDPHTHFTRLFFENDWTSLSDLESYGHDIETSWLLYEAAEVFGDSHTIERAREISLQMAEAVYQKGLDTDGAVLHEGSAHDLHDPSKHWWCQAEGIVGFVNAYQLSGNEKYARAAQRIWQFIEQKMVDRKHGEWFKVLDRAGAPLPGQLKAGPWEDPYHHTRACLEIVNRFDRHG